MGREGMSQDGTERDGERKLTGRDVTKQNGNSRKSETGRNELAKGRDVHCSCSYEKNGTGQDGTAINGRGNTRCVDRPLARPSTPTDGRDELHLRRSLLMLRDQLPQPHLIVPAPELLRQIVRSAAGTKGHSDDALSETQLADAHGDRRVSHVCYIKLKGRSLLASEEDWR